MTWALLDSQVRVSIFGRGLFQGTIVSVVNVRNEPVKVLVNVPDVAATLVPLSECWFPTERVSCGDSDVFEYQTDGIPTPTVPRGKWLKMRMLNRDGTTSVAVRSGDGWKDEE